MMDADEFLHQLAQFVFVLFRQDLTGEPPISLIYDREAAERIERLIAESGRPATLIVSKVWRVEGTRGDYTLAPCRPGDDFGAWQALGILTTVRGVPLYVLPDPEQV
jgi:hypothetical protein